MLCLPSSDVHPLHFQVPDTDGPFPEAPPTSSYLIGHNTMSSGSAQDVVVERFLRDIERRGKKLHCTVIGREGSGPHGDMNLLYRKSRLDWRHRDGDGNKKRWVLEKGKGAVWGMGVPAELRA